MGQKAKQQRSKITSDSTLEELDGERWGEPTFDSYIVRTCHALRRKPLVALTDEELRLAVGQGIGLEWLVPLLLERLAENPWRAWDCFDGGLLASLARIPLAYWTEHPTEKAFLVTDIMSAALADDRSLTMSLETKQAFEDLRAVPT